MLKHWREEDATSDEARLLAAARSETASESSRARTLAALGLGAALGGAAPAAVAGKSWLLSTPARWLSMLGVVGVGAAIAWSAARPSPKTAAPAAPPVASVPAMAATAPPSATPASIAVGDLPRVATAPAAGPPALGSASAAGGLSRELEALDRARRAVARGDAPGALRELDAYRREFPKGELAPEETVLRVRTLLAMGDRESARVLADEFEAAHPSSPYAARVHALVHD